MNVKKITTATLEDIDEITKLYIESVHKHFKGTLPDEELAMWIYENEKKRFTKQIADNSTILRVIRIENNELVGFTRFGADPDNEKMGCLESIFIKDCYHHKKYGTALFLDSQEIMRAMEYKRMILWTPTKGWAHGFYRKLGGIQSGQKINEIGFDLTAYAWELTKE